MNNKMPVLFIGHGSPMNAIEDNEYSQSWEKIGQDVLKKHGKPTAIMVMSAHWLTSEATLVQTVAKPETIYDFYGFPDPLYSITYPASGAPDIARAIGECKMPGMSPARENSDSFSPSDSCFFSPSDSWGFDHGTWSVLTRMFPEANIPTFQISVDMTLPHFELYERLKTLAPLREQGILFIGSGNIVHNLRTITGAREGSPFPWAREFDENTAKAFAGRDIAALSNPEKLGDFRMAHPSDDHYRPLIGSFALMNDDDAIITHTPGIALGSAGMRSFVIG